MFIFLHEPVHKARPRRQGKTRMTAIYIIAGFIVLFGLLNIIEFGQVD